MEGQKQGPDFAGMDLGVARHLYETYYPRPYEIICCHCQQAAEKAIKRYPNELYLEDHHAKEALHMAEEILIWCQEQIGTILPDAEDTEHI